jgi:FKBP-type peptidyl-prolyl cis-trans isomerase
MIHNVHRERDAYEMKSMVKKRFVLTMIVFSFGLYSTAWSADEAFRPGPGGLRIKDLQLGNGLAAAPGQVATIHFAGWIDEKGTRGREVFNSRNQGQPVSFVIGTDGVMEGWNEGVIGMKPGGRRMLLIPPPMAWGDREIEDVVPANTAMMFRIELLKVTEQDSEPGSD